MSRFKLHSVLVFALTLVGLLSVVDGVHGRSVASRQDKPRDLFDQLLHNLADKYLPGYRADSGNLQWSVHPLPRGGHGLEKRQNVGAGSANSNDSDEEQAGGNTPTAPPVSLAGLMSAAAAGGNAGNAIPASVLAAAASASPTSSSSNGGSSSNNNNNADSSASPSGSAAGSDRSAAAAAASATNSPSAPASASAASSSPSSGTAAVPLSKLIAATPSPPSSSSPSSASVPSSLLSNAASPSSAAASASATPTKDAQTSSDASPSTSNVSLLNPKHKLFPLIVAGLACAGILVIMLLIAIARAIAHDQLRRDNLKKSYSFDSTSPSSSKKGGTGGDRFTSTPPGVNAARSLRRAMTKKKLGSFARRTQDGSVLIEVGDEVFAVPPHLADSYRERILREKRSRSDLTASDENGGGGFFGNVRPKYLNDGGPDGDEEQARMAYDHMLDGSGDAGGDGVRRSLSQRISDRLRALTTSGGPTTADARSPGPAMTGRAANAYSFNTSYQQPGAIRQSNLATISQKPVLTHGSNEWSIQQRPAVLQQDLHKTPRHGPGEAFGTAKVFPRTSSAAVVPTSSTPAQPRPAMIKTQPRKPPPKLELTLLTEKLADLEKQSSASSSASSNRGGDKRERRGLPKEASLTHSHDASSESASANGTFGGSATASESGSTIPGSFPGGFPDRTKSLHQSKSSTANPVNTHIGARRQKSIKPLILNMNPDHQQQQDGQAAPRSMGGYRHRHPDRSRTQIHERRSGAGAGLERKNTSTVALASPTRFTHEKSSKIFLQPTKPDLVASPSSTARPLPIPPPFNLPK